MGGKMGTRWAVPWRSSFTVCPCLKWQHQQVSQWSWHGDQVAAAEFFVCKLSSASCLWRKLPALLQHLLLGDAQGCSGSGDSGPAEPPLWKSRGSLCGAETWGSALQLFSTFDAGVQPGWMLASAMLGGIKLLRDHRGTKTIKTEVCPWCLLQAAHKGDGKGALLSTGAVQGPLVLARLGCGFQGGCGGCPCSDVVSLAVSACPEPAMLAPTQHWPQVSGHGVNTTKDRWQLAFGGKREEGRPKNLFCNKSHHKHFKVLQ